MNLNYQTPNPITKPHQIMKTKITYNNALN